MQHSDVQNRNFILIVDNDPQWVLHIKKQLKSKKIFVTGCTTIASMEKHLKKHPYRVVLFSLDLTGFSNLMTGKNLKSIYPTIHTVIATGAKPLSEYVRFPETEFDAFFSLSYKPETIAAHILKVLQEPCPECYDILEKEIALRKNIENRLGKKIDELQFADSINMAYLNEQSLSEILDMFSDAFKKLFGKGYLSLYTYDPASGKLIREYISLSSSLRHNIEKMLRRSIRTSAPVIEPGSILKKILTIKQSFFTTDPGKIEKIFNEFIEHTAQKKIIAPLIKTLRVKSCGIIPLVADGVIIGIVVFIKPDTTIHNQDNRRRLERLANHIALSLARIKKNQLLRQQKEDLNFLNNMNLALNRGDDLDKIQRLCQRQLKELFNCTGSQLYLYDDETNSLRLRNLNLQQTMITEIEKICGVSIRDIHIPLSKDSLYSRIFNSGRVHVHTDSSTIHRLVEEFIPSIASPSSPKYHMLKNVIPRILKIVQISTTINFPLIFEGQKIGLFDIHRSYPFSEEELNRLKIIVQSITSVLKKKMDENAFLKSERERKALINAIPDLIFLVDYQGRFISYHGNGITKLYAEPDRFLGKTISEIMPEDVARQSMACIENTIKNSGSSKFEYSLTMNGKDLYFSAQMVTVPENKVLILTRDITPYKTLEIELRHAHKNLESQIEKRTASLKKAMASLSESREKYYSLFSDAHDMINILDINGIIRDANRSELETLGYERDEYIGRSYLDIIHPDFRHRTQDYINSISSNHNKELFETCLLTQSGDSIFVEMIITPQYKEGQICTLRTISRDITARQKAEHRAIKISEKEQRRLGRELHDDIGQDITGIALLTKALEQKVPKNQEGVKKDLQNIISISNRTRQKLRGLAQGLYPAKLEIGGLETSLRAMAESTEFMHNIHCTLLCNSELKIRKSDEIHIYRIIQEAISNAVKHSGAENINIICRDHDDSVFFAIEDDGIGLRENNRNSEGLGFFIMKNRAKIINAILKINNGDVKGTKIELYVSKEGAYYDN